MTGGALNRSVRGLFLQRTSSSDRNCSSNKPNAPPYPELKYRHCCCSDWFHKYGSLLRNLSFNRSAPCTQVSDQCPLGLLLLFSFNIFYDDFRWIWCHNFVDWQNFKNTIYTKIPRLCFSTEWFLLFSFSFSFFFRVADEYDVVIL